MPNYVYTKDPQNVQRDQQTSLTKRFLIGPTFGLGEKSILIQWGVSCLV